MRRRLLQIAGVLVLGLVGAELGVHAFLNLGLPVLSSARPERFQLWHGGAWMIQPGEVRVRGLRVRGRGQRDQWELAVDRATLWVDLWGFRDGEVRISKADADGASFRWSARSPDPARPIQAHPWRVVLEDVRVTGVRELVVGDYGFTGDAVASGSLEVEARAWLEARSVVLAIERGEVSRVGSPVLSEVHGEVHLDYEGSDPSQTGGRLRVGAISGEIAVEANTRDLSLLDFYLREVAWLRLSRGVGALSLDVRVREGSFVEGSRARASVTEFVARAQSTRVTGTGDVLVEVDAPKGVPRTRLRLDLRDYALQLSAGAPPHLVGEGLVVTATTSEVAIDQPFTSLEVEVDLPEAQILDVDSYNAYLPDGMGISLGSGSGTVRAQLRLSTGTGDCTAEVFVDGHDVNLDLDEVAMVGDLSVHGVIPSGNVARGTYDISGSAIALLGLEVRSGSSARPDRDDADGWWARVSVPSGQLSGHAPIFATGTVELSARDTIPLVTLFAERHRVPGWIRGVVTTGPVRGTAEVSMGRKLVRVSGLRLSAGNFVVLGEVRRREHAVGKLYVQFGTVSLAMGIGPAANNVVLINSRRWYDAEPAPD